MKEQKLENGKTECETDDYANSAWCRKIVIEDLESDTGTIRVELEADAPRVSCRAYGVIVAHRRGDHHPSLDDTSKLHDQFARLTWIGIDEISYKRGHKYLSVVVDHDSDRLVWAAPPADADSFQAE